MKRKLIYVPIYIYDLYIYLSLLIFFIAETNYLIFAILKKIILASSFSGFSPSLATSPFRGKLLIL